MEGTEHPSKFRGEAASYHERFQENGHSRECNLYPILSRKSPEVRRDIAWSESSAISFSNSVIGARTNREGGPSALAASLCGVTPNYGLHLDEKRKPEVLVEVTAKLEDNADFGALGYVIGKKVKNRIPYFRGIKDADTDQLKALGAAMAASGAVALYHIEHLTPEAHMMKTEALERLSVNDKDLEETFSHLSTGKEPDIVILGCPHSSLKEIMTISHKLEGKKLTKHLWVCTSRMVKEAANRMGFTQTIEAAGGKVVADTCMVVSPIEDMGYKTTGVNSGKAANYLPGFCKQNVVFSKLDTLLEKVT